MSLALREVLQRYDARHKARHPTAPRGLLTSGEPAGCERARPAELACGEPCRGRDSGRGQAAPLARTLSKATTSATPRGSR